MLLLESLSESPVIYLRHYAWERPCHTFGYTQQYTWAHATVMEITGETSPILQRRPTGGGVVGHGHDFTYSLVVPATTALGKEQACVIYNRIHTALADALKKDNPHYVSHLKSCHGRGRAKAPSVCFRQPETFDLVLADDSLKIAGAAQKRTKDGLLMQGSIDLTLAPQAGNADFFQHFAESLSTLLALPTTTTDFPRFSAERTNEWYKKMASAEWNHKR